MIEEVKAQRNQLVVSVVNKPRVVIVVSHNKEWKKQIEKAIVNSNI